ncbi:hypothetical protein ACJMK2_023732 [Sinanodonta woodiana]|uniref:Succinate--hydroxymethylglutarate CoA-transferase n=1 Tax=Sinanodonta woodiana TaxID=1069815 RepID=A0ABD3T6U1_SINWO
MTTIGGFVSKICRKVKVLDPAKCKWYSTQTTKSGPLEGLRVLDLTRVLAGPYCSMLFGDLGAEVIKVERPGQGDDTRSWGPPFIGTESAYFFSINRNKKSVALNIKEAEGQDLVKKLAQKSDVLLENYIPGKLSELGLGYSQIKEVAPKLIYCSITGYGQSGPYSKRAGYDVMVEGIGGLAHITGPEDGDPCKVGVAITDLSTGLYAMGSILAALIHRQKTGRGQHIDCNLLSTQVASLVNIGSNYLNAGIEAKRYGTSHASIVPYQAFKTKNGHFMVGAGNDHQFKLLCQLLHLDDLASHPDFISNRQRVKNRVELVNILTREFSKKSTEEWLSAFESSGIPFGAINNMQQVFSDPQVLHNNLIQEMEHSTAGKIRVAGPAVKYSESTTVLQYPPPLLGEHTDIVLQELLGLSSDELGTLRDKGIIQ